jgi:glucosamine--fructose-6-phosphate aminotransferase (isomerizing)
LADDTECTWRIGDGTAAFYNYIYTTVAGFSEHDTFRSNQIREGQLTRDRAMELVERDNQPRWKSIREYTQLINIDFDEAIRVIDRIPKLYGA